MMRGDLTDEQFWASAFEREAPFYDNYVKYFGKAVVEKNPAVLDVHREAIYYIKDEALVPIVINLIHVAEMYPGNGFVESLAFFLSHENQEGRLKKAFRDVDAEVIAEVRGEIDGLCRNLSQSGDDDLVEQFSKFVSLIS